MLKNNIVSKCFRSPRCELLFADNLKSFGTPKNIRVVLFCAEDDALFVRLAHGNYIKLNKYSLLGTRYPNYRRGRKSESPKQIKLELLQQVRWHSTY
ncbi:DUF6088 family protein [Sphingobacterium sp. UBA7249]|uniref:DUF6088 family protein n=1 Tax=Sphingobacterium sp. UBA7249 TaxID=1947516 RepID=UPI0039C9A157